MKDFLFFQFFYELYDIVLTTNKNIKAQSNLYFIFRKLDFLTAFFVFYLGGGRSAPALRDILRGLNRARPRLNRKQTEDKIEIMQHSIQSHNLIFVGTKRSNPLSKKVEFY